MQDRSFTFILKTPPASDLLKKAAKVRPGGKSAGGIAGMAEVPAGTGRAVGLWRAQSNCVRRQVKAGSGTPNSVKVGEITQEQLKVRRPTNRRRAPALHSRLAPRRLRLSSARLLLGLPDFVSQSHPYASRQAVGYCATPVFRCALPSIDWCAAVCGAMVWLGSRRRSRR